MMAAPENRTGGGVYDIFRRVIERRGKGANRRVRRGLAEAQKKWEAFVQGVFGVIPSLNSLVRIYLPTPQSFAATKCSDALNPRARIVCAHTKECFMADDMEKKGQQGGQHGQQGGQSGQQSGQQQKNPDPNKKNPGQDDEQEERDRQ